MKKVLAGILAALLIPLLVPGCGEIELRTEYTDWTIYEKHYTPATEGTPGHWGWSFADNGGLVYIGGTAGDEARYEFFLKRVDSDGTVKTAVVSVSSDEYMSYEVGDTYTTEQKYYARVEEGEDEDVSRRY